MAPELAEGWNGNPTRERVEGASETGIETGGKDGAMDLTDEDGSPHDHMPRAKQDMANNGQKLQEK